MIETLSVSEKTNLNERTTRICAVLDNELKVSETFIAGHLRRLKEVVGVIHAGRPIPKLNGEQILRNDIPSRISRKGKRIVLGQGWEREIVDSYLEAFRKIEPNVVLAEYGQAGVAAMEACHLARVPLVVHFHGYDASKYSVIAEYGDRYKRMFEIASAIIGVSKVMVNDLLNLGCPPEKLIHCPYGIDCEQFSMRNFTDDVPGFLSVGRFVPKKAPHLTILAFAQVVERVQGATLRMIGDGPLLEPCKDIVRGLGLDGSVEFLGAQPHDVVSEQMRAAAAFVQHSITSADGDREGTPVAVLEAGGIGLPVIATRHAGIPDVVAHNETGLLVDEYDVAGMATHMVSLAMNPEAATSMGKKAAEHIRRYYTTDHSISRLATVLQAASERLPLDAIRQDIAQSLPA